MARWKLWAALVLGAMVWVLWTPVAEAQGGTASAAEMAEARRLNNEAMALFSQARYDAALSVAQRALVLFEKNLGSEHPDVATVVNNLAGIHEARGEDALAEPLHRRALAIREKALRPDHPDVATSLNNLAVLYANRGEYARAESFSLRAVASLEKSRGVDHLDVGRALNNLAMIQCRKGEYDRAEVHALRSVSIVEKALGSDHPELANSLNTLATLYEKKGAYDRAQSLFERVLAVRERAQGYQHPDVATALNNLAELHWVRGNHTLAASLYERAIAISEKTVGPDHPSVSVTLSNLAALRQTTGDYGSALALYRRALSIAEKAFGPEHPAVIASLSNLAQLHEAMGEYDVAEGFYKRVLDSRARGMLLDRANEATLLNNLGSLAKKKGDHDRAEVFFQRALDIFEKTVGSNHAMTSGAVNNLASVHQEKGNYVTAELLYVRALATLERIHGPSHPLVAAALNNLASLCMMEGDYHRAEPLFRRALSIMEASLGSNHPDVATALENLATLSGLEGDHERAESLSRRALDIREATLGSSHPDAGRSLDNFGVLSWKMGRLPEAIAFLTRGQDVAEKTLVRVVATGSEAQKRAYLATLANSTKASVSLALQTRDPRAARLALTTLLRRKGRALDAMTHSFGTLRAHLGPGEQRLFDELQAARSQYVNLALRGPGTAPLQPYRERLVALDAQIQDREVAISDRSAAFRAQQQLVTVDAVQAALPEDTALVEWTVYEPLNIKTHHWDAARYAACVLPKHGDPVWIDLGEAEAIDAGVTALRAALRRPGSDRVSAPARAFEARVMAPVRAALRDVRRAYLSPDGALNLVPIAALIGDDGRYLIERYAFTYLTSGRDLLRFSAQMSAREGPLVLASPDFDVGATPGAGRFGPLTHAEQDAAAVAQLFPGARTLLHAEASKARLQEAHGPLLLHVGTHGYFGAPCTRPEQAAPANPLLRSGIALAGANACASGRDDGLLTALEASGLDLYGTKLAVLSACHTGVGDIMAGDGVYGLRRALVLAGAETQVMTLWPVRGDTTSAMMKGYYEALKRGRGRSEAMREVQLAMLHSAEGHPYHWASFIVSGDDRTLLGNAAAPDLRVHGGCTCELGREPPAIGALWLFAAAMGIGWRRRSRYLTERRSRRAGSRAS